MSRVEQPRRSLFDDCRMCGAKEGEECVDEPRCGLPMTNPPAMADSDAEDEICPTCEGEQVEYNVYGVGFPCSTCCPGAV